MDKVKIEIEQRAPFACRSSIVYKYKCGSCDATYVGFTSRQQNVRMAEHRGVSPRTGSLLNTPAFSRIREHSYQQDHRINTEDFSIKAQTKHPTNLKILEALYIKSEKPSLNGDCGAFSLKIT